MTVYRSGYVVECDGGGVCVDAGLAEDTTSADEARAFAATKGWRSEVRNGTLVDFCPRCIRAEESLAAEEAALAAEKAAMGSGDP